ncbi:hypothetical protein E4H12_05725 [Candidatus Thorarchaeota archaeon]|nr:MAG: hypothetical protein E4H12_05725 [Candidatus Thorarchaeota archaeon]
MYINVTEAKGFEVGHLSRVFKPATHRVLIENDQIYGSENFVDHFKRDGKVDRDEWVMFVNLIRTLPMGSYGELSWERE